jgi:hypothetical protein
VAVDGSTPFNNPEANPELVEVWRTLIAKARQEIPPPPVLPASININFDSAGTPLTANMAGLCEIAFPCRILSCHMFAGTASGSSGILPTVATATVDLRIGSQGQWAGGSMPLYPAGAPTMTNTSEAAIDTTGWIDDLQPGDLLLWRLVSIVGTATWLSVTLRIRRLDVTGLGVAALTNQGAVNFTDASGASFVVRG